MSQPIIVNNRQVVELEASELNAVITPDVVLLRRYGQILTGVTMAEAVQLAYAILDAANHQEPALIEEAEIVSW
jgi:hypothetical protein